MASLVERLGGKEKGFLIKAKEWNELVEALQQLKTELADHITHTEAEINRVIEHTDAKVGLVEDLVTTLQGEVDALSNKVEPLLGQYYLLTLQTSRERNAIGQVAEITAKVTDLWGEPLDLTGGSRPWIDFVATWGQLRPAPAYASGARAGDRSLSVQTDREGIARVHLTADHAAGFSDEEEEQVAAELEKKAPEAEKKLVEVIMEAVTPSEAALESVYASITSLYQLSNPGLMARYVDKYYWKKPDVFTDKIGPSHVSRWHDYHATVVAFVKADDDPRKQGHCLGASSMLITFRDWISPWAGKEFIQVSDALIQKYLTIFTALVRPTYAATFKAMKEAIHELVEKEGHLGKMRVYRGIYEALSLLTLPDPPPFLPKLIENLQNIIAFQQTQIFSQAATVGSVGKEVALDTLTESTSYMETKVDGIQAEVALAKTELGGEITATKQSFEQRFGQIDEKVTRIDTDVENVMSEQVAVLQRDVSFLQGQVDHIDANVLGEGGELRRIEKAVNTLEGQYSAFAVEGVEPSTIKGKLVELRGLEAQLESVHERVLKLEGPSG
jgi:hypothetical protein